MTSNGPKADFQTLFFFWSQLYCYHAFGHACPLDGDDLSGHCYNGNIALLMLAGLLVNGPYALITTAVSAELGVHPSLQGKFFKIASFFHQFGSLF